jgi:hypothetical protein
MSKAYDRASAILEEKGMELTDDDVDQIEFLSAGFTYEETVNLKPWLYECIEQVRNSNDTKLSQDGRT